VEAIAILEDQWQPAAFYHVAQGLRWQVREVLDGWTHPGWPGRTYQKPAVQKRYRLQAFGPAAGAAGPARGVRDDRHLLRQPGPLVDQARGPPGD
jgi:hypothetical protein